MYPAYCPPCDSPAEPELFHALRDGEGTEDWIVLHSLDIANHVSQLSGEADFVVIVPGRGVLCLEVKGAKSIQRTADGWYVGRNGKLDVRGPFKQASAAMHSLRKSVVKRNPQLSGVMFWSAVVLPYIAFEEQSQEWHDWQVIDAQRYNSLPFSALVLQTLTSATDFASRKATWFDSCKSAPTQRQAQQIADILRPRFELFESPRNRARRIEAEIRHYTDEQFVALDSMSLNRRVIFEGAAGTGKTLMAIESARRASAAGDATLVLCFNRQLAGWLRAQCEPLASVVTESLHAYMLSASGVSVPTDADSVFWEEELPALAAEALLAQNRPQFEHLVIDEAQDVLRSQYLDVLDLAVCGGLRQGRWNMFGDFRGQDIYGATSGLSADEFERRIGEPTRCRLTKNCRNTPRVSALVSPLGGLMPDYSAVLRPDDGFDPTWLYHKDADQQLAHLERAIAELLSEGYRKREIVVLSPLANDCSCAAQLARKRPLELAAYQPEIDSRIRYCSIHAFKGLESSAVIVTDISDVEDSSCKALLYVAITRTTGRLLVCAHDSQRQPVASAILTSLLETGR